MSYIYLLYLFLLFLLDCRHCLQQEQDLRYMNLQNLQCRDNTNDPVDWWYLYKPPSNVGPLLESGINFSFITPDYMGRWMPSRNNIFGKSMLRHTLSPMYSTDYAEHMALVVYEGQEATENFKGSASLGLMMANEMGGVWIGHTIPGFPALSKDESFPATETKNGHLIMCFTIGLPILNTLAVAIKQTEPNIRKLVIPNKMKLHLPDWAKLLEPVSDTEDKISKTSVKKTKILHFLTRDKSLRGVILARSPGDTRCLYKSFAKTKGIVMDVYGHIEHQNAICEKQYSLRNINSISLKYPELVYYINNVSDSMGFAVSTAATWQRAGHSKLQYWTCTGNIENQPFSGKGGIIVCVTDYHVWLTFDNLKIKEPDCY